MHIPVTDPSMRVFVLVLPWTEFANQKKTKKEALNLNVYRNLYYRALSAMKKNFDTRAKDLIKDGKIPPLGKVWLHYEIHPNQKGRVDTMNVGSIVDKFFSDSLTGAGIIEDDDYTRVVFNSFSFGCVVKGEAFVKVHITELEPRKERAMRVLLDQEDIQAALEAYVEERGISGATGVKLSAEDGELTAEVLFGTTATMTKSTDDEDQPPKPTKNRGGRPAGSKNKPKEDSDDVGSSASGGSGSDAEGNGDKGGNAPKTFPEDDEDDLFDKGVGQPKENPSGGSQEESSKGINGADEDAETETLSSGGVKKKASSIFDDED